MDTTGLLSGSGTSGGPAPLATSRESELRIVSYLLQKVHDEFDEDLVSLCDAYAKKHTPLKKGLEKLRRREVEDRLSNEPFATRVNNIFEKPFETVAGTVIFAITTLVILTSVIILMIRTVPAYNPVVVSSYKSTWLAIEGVIAVFFIVELLLRLAVSPRKLDFMKKLTTIADIVALVPFFLNAAASFDDLSALQMLRLFRVFVFFRRFRSVDSLFRAVWSSVRVLAAPLLFLGTCLFIVSTVLYFAERGTYDSTLQTFTIRDCNCESSPAFLFGPRSCPRVESQFFSIPHTLWWGVVTMTTVGYGDLVPQCPYGKLVAAVSMVLGVVFMAMPIAIVGNYFTLSVRQREQLKAKARLEKVRDHGKAELDKALNNVELDVADQSPAVRFLRFLNARLPEEALVIADPTPYAMMLLDYYFGTLPFNSRSAPPAITYELTRIPDAPRLGGSATLARGTTPGAKRLTLNRGVSLVIGAATSRSELPEPDVVLPVADEAGQPYRVSARHAVLQLPPQYSEQLPLLRPLPGCIVYVNDEPVDARGVRLRQGDVINFHDRARPLAFKLDGVHPFALDL